MQCKISSTQSNVISSIYASKVYMVCAKLNKYGIKAILYSTKLNYLIDYASFHLKEETSLFAISKSTMDNMFK